MYRNILIRTKDAGRNLRSQA